MAGGCYGRCESDGVRMNGAEMKDRFDQCICTKAALMIGWCVRPLVATIHFVLFAACVKWWMDSHDTYALPSQMSDDRPKWT